MISPDDRKLAAQAIVAIPLFNDLMDDLEATAVNRAVASTQQTADDRQSALLAIKAIRDLRSQIGALAESQPTKRKQAPA